MPTTPKGNLGTIAATWATNVRTLEKGGGGSPFSRTPLLGATRNAGGTITELGDINEPVMDLAQRTEWLKAQVDELLKVHIDVDGHVNNLTLANNTIQLLHALPGPVPAGKTYRLKSYWVASSLAQGAFIFNVDGVTNLEVMDLTTGRNRWRDLPTPITISSGQEIFIRLFNSSGSSQTWNHFAFGARFEVT